MILIKKKIKIKKIKKHRKNIPIPIEAGNNSRKYSGQKSPFDDPNNKTTYKEYFHKVKITKKNVSNTPKYEKRSLNEINNNNSSLKQKKSKKKVFLYSSKTMDEKLSNSNKLENANDNNKTNLKKSQNNHKHKDIDFSDISEIKHKNDIDASNSSEHNQKKTDKKNSKDININKEEKNENENESNKELEKNNSMKEKNDDNLDDVDNNFDHHEKFLEKMENMNF
jgi:hypothetical protein